MQPAASLRRRPPPLPGGHRAITSALSRNEARTALAAAAAGGCLEAVQELLAAGAPAAADRSMSGGQPGFTALHCAAAGGHLEVCRALLAAGAPAAAATGGGDDALSLALRGGHLEVAAALLAAAPGEGERQAALDRAARCWRAGFRPSGQGVRGTAGGGGGAPSPQSQEAERAELAHLVRALVAGDAGAGAEASAAAVALAAAGSAGLLRRLLAAGAAVGHADAHADANGASFPLLHARRLGWPAMRRLLEAGADPNRASAGGATCLHALAAEPALLAPAQQLVRWRGVDLLRRDGGGRDALALALRAGNRAFGEALLRALIEGGGSVGWQAPARRGQRGQQGQQWGGAAPLDQEAVAASLWQLLASWPGFTSLAGLSEPQQVAGDPLLIAQVIGRVGC